MSRVPVVIDTNVVFKALRLKYSFIREVLNQGTYHFYAPKFLLVEILRPCGVFTAKYSDEVGEKYRRGGPATSVKNVFQLTSF